MAESSYQNSTNILGVEFAPLSTPWERRLQTIGIIVFTFMASLLIIGWPTLIILTWFYPAIGLLYASWMYYDRDTPYNGGRRYEFARRWGIWNLYRDFFPLKLIKTADFDPKRNYLLGAHPHGMFAVAPVGCFATDALGFQKLFPNMTPHLLTLDIFYRIPFVRDLLLIHGACPAEKKSMNYILSYPQGGKVGILVPGGVPEMLESHPNTDTLVLKNRKGFIKLALQNGCPLVPVYSFGENNLYNQLNNPEGSIVRKIQLSFMKVIGFYLPVYNGRGVLQYSFGFLPKRIPMTTVVGEPIEVEKTSEPTQAQIDSLHEKYVSGLKDLFYSYREQCGYPKAELQII